MWFWSWLFGRLSEPRGSAPTEPGWGEARRSTDGSRTAVAEQCTTPATNEPTQPIGTAGHDSGWMAQADSLLDPVEPRPPEPAGDALALENILVSHFDGHDLSIPSLHNVAERVLPKLRGPDADLLAAAKEIAEDQVLAAAVLRTVNSPLYRGVETITSVPRAVARLGVRTIKTILMHQSLRGAIFGRGPNHFADVLWRRSLASACIMRGLASFTKMDLDEAYLLGLLHDIGGVIVLRILRAEEKRGFDQVDLDTFEYLCRQSHQEFGELIAEAWKLPADLKSLIADHHSHPPADDPLRTERLMLILTEMIASVLSYAPPENYNLIQCRAARDLQFSERRDYINWLTALPAEIDDLIAES